MQSQDTRDAHNPATTPYYAQIQQLAAQHDLGSAQIEYTRTTVQGTRLIINAVIWFAIALAGLYFLISALFRLRDVYTDSESLQSVGAVAIISLILLGGCLLQSWHNIRAYYYRHREQIHIFEDGFVYLEGRDKTHTIRWDEIDSLLRGTLDPKRTGRIMRDRLNIITDKDQVITINPRLQQRVEICDLIERLYTEYRLPGMLELFKLGEDLEFGDMVINRQGISHFIKNSEDEESVKWDEVTSIEVGNQFTRVHTTTDQDEKSWFEAITPDVENALILKELLPHLPINP